jgi:hypothetical protein
MDDEYFQAEMPVKSLKECVMNGFACSDKFQRNDSYFSPLDQHQGNKFRAITIDKGECLKHEFAPVPSQCSRLSLSIDCPFQ